MKVSVITPFVEKTQKVINCVESAKKQSYKNVEVIAVSEKTKLGIKGVKSILTPKERDVGKKRNIGAKIASGDILFFVDCDCILKRDSIKNLVDTFKRTGADVVSGKTLAPSKGNLLGIVTGLEYEDRFNQMGEKFVNVAATTCLGIRKNVFNKVGGFRVYSKTELAVGEDWDFSARLRKKGYTIYHTNKVRVIHDHGDESLGHWFKRRIQHSKYRIIHKKRYGKLADEYSSWKMLISTTFLFAIPVVIRMFPKTKNFKLFALPFFAFLRNIAWFIGMITGWIEARNL